MTLEPSLATTTTPVAADHVYVDHSLNIFDEESSTHPSLEIIQPRENTPVKAHQQQFSQARSYNHRVTAEHIKTLANTKFDNTGRGLTWEDLLKRSYKCADTREQAQNILRNHHKRGNLYANTSITMPQQYFCSKDQAEIAVINKQRITHPDPSGVPLLSIGLSRRSTAITASSSAKASSANPSSASHHASKPALSHCLGERTHNFLQALLSMPSAATKWHNLRFDFSLLPDGPDPPSAPYHDRLAWIQPDPNKSQAKTLPTTHIDGYEITIDVYPNAGKVIIAVPSSERPLPFPNTEDIANEFLIFLGEIRGYIQRCLSDRRGVLVPSALSWRFVHADINKDVPCSPELFLTLHDMEMTRVDGVFRLYARMLQGYCHVRLEKGNHVFNQTVEQTMEQAIASLVKELGGRGTARALQEDSRCII